jgi:hypothetical protein
MKVAFGLLFSAACGGAVPPSTPIAIPTTAATSTASAASTSTPVASSSVCAHGEVLVLGRYEPLCATACASDPDCKTLGPCDDATDTDGHPVKVCAATGEPPKKKP